MFQPKCVRPVLFQGTGTYRYICVASYGRSFGTYIWRRTRGTFSQTVLNLLDERFKQRTLVSTRQVVRTRIIIKSMTTMAPPSTTKPIGSTRKRPVEPATMAVGGNCSQVRVCVRVRPITAKEQGAGSTNVLEVWNENVVQLSGRRFTYDAAFDATTTQAHLYRQLAPTLLQSFLDGFNATVR
jgi:hypothetical protein